MERILHYEIKASDDSPTVACFLKRHGYSSANLTDLKKMPESILINGTPSYMIRHLQGGDRLTVHIQETAVSEKIPPVYHPLDIVYEDEDLMVINKPADLPIHPSMRNYTHSLANGLAWYFAQKDCPFVFRCINRLDHNTSGLTIIAKHLVSGSILATMVRNREIHRESLAAGSLPPPEPSPLHWDERTAPSSSVPSTLNMVNLPLLTMKCWKKETDTA